MIFLSLGTHEQPFARAIDALAPLAESEDIVIQYGHTPPRESTPGFSWFEFAEYDRIAALIREASLVVCHAGVGTIMTALAQGKIPLVIPRLHRHGEHVDDHQLQIAHEFAEKGFVVTLEEDGDVVAAAEEARSRRHKASGASEALKRAVVLAADGEKR